MDTLHVIIDFNVHLCPEQRSDQPSSTTEHIPADIWGKPRKGKYTDVRHYLEDRKKGDPEFKEFCLKHSLREICSYLTDLFGWDVDEHSLGANLNRNR